MNKPFLLPKVTIFDTTMRDGELTPSVKMNINQKVSIAKLLEEMHVDVIEVGYPGVFKKDFDEIFTISKLIKESVICGLANSTPEEITSLALALKPAVRGRINIYTPVNLKQQSELTAKQTLEVIKNSITLARNYCTDIEWSAFDAPRSDSDFLCGAIEIAIKSGATTINIPDSFGSLSPEKFSELITMIVNRVPNIEKATISVHCHDDLGLAVDNSIAALSCGARQIEVSINGLGARKGNADLAQVVMAIDNSQNYRVDINNSLLAKASQLVSQITGISIPI
ncbi:MAG: 2-isopropylmalate synthase [Symploca sp. SIO1C4]|uniref:2-isopropylmalate synthase n=1 Tax=Symploca sp. SIO1C4 TaxID=2607765 RepID=A0A6B3NG36_9CYAN|nr:2-isopropylmalate synthase [Symploca sp. SIO1C4]